MKIDTEYSAGRLRVLLYGELDHHGARYAVESIGGAIDNYLPRDLVLDLSGLSFMDSSGIAVIVRTNRRLQLCGGRMRIECPQAQPLKVLDASGIDRLVPVRVQREVTT